MKHFIISLMVIGGFLLSSCSCSKSDTDNTAYVPLTEVDHNTICFFYNWYGTPEFDGDLYHWKHNILPNGDGQILGTIPGTGNNIAANYFPESGIYSSQDPDTIRRQMEEMASAGIGVVALTWWKNADIGQSSIPTLLNEANRVGMKLCFHIEPYDGRTADSFKSDIKGLIDQFGEHPAFYRINGKPLFFVYDSYKIDQDDWSAVLTADGKNTIRGTAYDSYIIGLLLNVNDRYSLRQSGFDGMYTYFASTGFTEGSTPANWADLQSWCSSQGMLFIPSVGPGYIDTRIRPWNGANARERNDGKYYEDMFNGAIDAGAKYISITSFNEWHEGTQIEPAKPMETDDKSFTYLDFSPEEPDFYLTETLRHVTRFVNERNK